MSFNTKLTFCSNLTRTDPHDNPVLIIGQVKHLNLLKFNDVKAKLEPRVSEEYFRNAVSSLHPSPSDTCSLYLNFATIAALPIKCSRHNTPSRCHTLTRLVQNCSVNVDESIVVVCERKDVYASACAVARAFPTYSRKTGINTHPVNGRVRKT